MANNTYCTRCNTSCQSCNTCQSCNASCNAPTGCNTKQSFCAISGQNVGGFSFGVPLATDSYFFSKSTWNKIYTYINNAFLKGATQGGGSSGLPASDTSEFMTANAFNSVASALGRLGSAGPSVRVSPNDLIYGSYFQTLETYANNLKYTTTQCDNCNVNCNVSCNVCQKCTDGCQANSPSYSTTCESCNTCQSAAQLAT